MNYLIVFDSTSQAIKAEAMFNQSKINIKVRPIPNEVSSGCGISVYFDDIDKVKEVIKNEKLGFSNIYQIKDTKFITYIQKVRDIVNRKDKDIRDYCFSGG